MESAVLSARRGIPIAAWTLLPAAVALSIGLAYLALEPRPGDLAAHVFRAELFGREGFTIWNGHWYGGHHTPAYSVLTPALSWLLGPRLVLVAACVAIAALFEALARGHFGAERARFGALWLGVGTATLLATSRLPFAVGTAFGLAAALALQRDRPRTAVAFALLSPLASPVAERALIEDGLPYLRLRWKSDDWRVYEVLLRAPLVIPQGDARVKLEQLGSDELLLDVCRPGEALVRVRWTPYWFAAGGCVERAGEWTRVIARRPGFVRLSTRFSLERVVEHGRRCDGV